MATWTMEEFTVLLNNHGLNDAQCATVIGTRTPGAVAAVRAGVHGWHGNGDHTMLNEMMVGYLAQGRRRKYSCALCQNQF